MRPAWADIDLAAVRHNVGVIRELVAPAQVCAVVKADGYGHGAVPVAQAALEAGATCLAVALVEEGAQLREAGIDVPVLVLSEPSAAEMEEVVSHRLRPTVYTQPGVAALAKAVEAADGPPVPVHLKVDTGMHRVGAQPEEIVALAAEISSHGALELEGLWTHCAVADEPGNSFTDEQRRRFEAVIRELTAVVPRPPVLHAANSAAAIAAPGCRFDLVRTGIAIYGVSPGPELDGVLPLRPAMSLKARVSHVKVVPAGESISYGHWHRFERDSVVATVPLGYADGVRRRLGITHGEVLLGGRRRKIVGAVTMDQFMVDCGDDRSVSVGDEVVVFGEQGDERIRVEDVAALLGTIGYEIVCGVGPRVPRQYQ